MTVRVQRDDFDLGHEVAALRADRPAIGAVASFIGTVRDVSDGSEVRAMELEHYPGMTEKALERIEAVARERWALQGVTIIHRVGPLLPQDQIVLVAVASAHRGEAFAACEFIMDYLKSEAPFWKKEETPEGARWVDARVSDEAALGRWGIASLNAGGQGERSVKIDETGRNGRNGRSGETGETGETGKAGKAGKAVKNGPAEPAGH